MSDYVVTCILCLVCLLGCAICLWMCAEIVQRHISVLKLRDRMEDDDGN